MAAIRWYLAGNRNANSGYQNLTQTVQSAVTLASGWVVGTGATLNSEFSALSGDRAATTFSGSTVPDGTLDDTIFDAFQSDIPLTGTFAAGNWTFQFAVVSTVQAGAADGQVVVRLIKAGEYGENPTLITPAQQSSSVITNVTTTDLNGTLTFNPGAIAFANEWLFVQVAWKRTGAGGMTTTNIRLRTGSSATVGTTILTSDFTTGPQASLTQTLGGAALLGESASIALRSRAQGGGTAGSTTIESPAQAHTTGSSLVALIEWNNQGSYFSSISDTAGNTWLPLVTNLLGGEGGRWCIYWAPNIVGHSANVVTVTITVADYFRCIVVYEFANLNPARSGSNVWDNNTSSRTAFNAGTVTVSESSVITALCMGIGPPITGAPGYTAVNFSVPGNTSLYFLDQYKFVTTSEPLTASQSTASQGTLLGSSFNAIRLSGATGTVTGEYIPPRQAVLTQTLANATVVATGESKPPIVAALAQTVGPATLAATGVSSRFPIAAALTHTIGPATLVATGTVEEAAPTAEIAFDAVSQGYANATSLTFTHTCAGADRFLVVAFKRYFEDDILSVTYNGVALTHIATANFLFEDTFCLLYGLTNPAAGGAFDVVITGTSANHIVATAASYTGVAQTGQPEAFGVDEASGLGSAFPTATVVSTGAWLVGCGVTNYSGSGFIEVAGTTIRKDNDLILIGIQEAIDSGGVVGTGPQFLTVTIGGSSGAFVGAVAVLAPSSGEAPPGDLSAVLTQTLGAATVLATATVQSPISATLAQSVGPASLVATGVSTRLPLTAGLTQTLGPVTLTATGQLERRAALTQTLGSTTVVGIGVSVMPSGASLTQTLGSATLTATGIHTPPVTAVVSATLAPVTVVATAESPQPLTAVVTQTLASATVVATGVLAPSFAVNAVVNQTLGHVTLATRTTAPPTMTVWALGRWKVPGNTQAHTLYLIDSNGAVLRSAVLDFTEGKGVDNQFNYVPIAPYHMSGGGTKYAVYSSEVMGGDGWLSSHGGQTIPGIIVTPTPGVVAQRSIVNNIGDQPVLGGVDGTGYAVNALFTSYQDRQYNEGFVTPNLLWRTPIEQPVIGEYDYRPQDEPIIRRLPDPPGDQRLLIDPFNVPYWVTNNWGFIDTDAVLQVPFDVATMLGSGQMVAPIFPIGPFMEFWTQGSNKTVGIGLKPK